jgi:hypothetical protein
VLRVLYRLRALSEQTPLDSATFSYAFPLLQQVIQKGGVGSDKEDDPLEQVALSLDIIKFHCGECEAVCLIIPRLSSSQHLYFRRRCCFSSASNHKWIIACDTHSTEIKQGELLGTYRSRTSYFSKCYKRRNYTLTRKHPRTRGLRPKC